MTPAALGKAVNCSPSEIYVQGIRVDVTPLHVEMALLLYSARPFCMASTATLLGGKSVSRVFDYESAPAFYQHEILELAHAALQHPKFQQ